MTDTVIRVENLSKRYRLGELHKQTGSFREKVTGSFKRLVHRANYNKPLRSANGSLPHASSPVPHAPRSTPSSSDDFIWALKDISFEVKRGEVLGIIGRNGAGKTTLLKILSRITKPTEGTAHIDGRMASLLEVGTGFHPELTGRENIFLNGAILGMTKVEITRKFDEIVDFAEIEKFIDTPVKRYSSGMYVRLAFAVAAYLEPEILLVDEVLAVGDAEFQNKCLGKMGEVANVGRTILFVSHNMQAIQALCKRALYIDKGSYVEEGDSETVVANYLGTSSLHKCETSWGEEHAPGNADIKLISVIVHSNEDVNHGVLQSKKDIYIDLKFIAYKRLLGLCVGFDLMNSGGHVITRTYQNDQRSDKWPNLQLGENIWRCTIPAGLLNAGKYLIAPKIGIHNVFWIVNLDAVVQFEQVLDHGVSPYWNVLDGRNRPGVIAPILKWYSISNGQ